MPPALRGSPCREILLLGTCLSLAMPIAPAAAEPAALPDWGAATKSKAAAPAPAPEPAPPPTPVASPSAPAADPEDEIIPDDAPAAKRRSTTRRAGKVTRSKPRTKALKSSLERAESERKSILEHAHSLETAGQADEAARSLVVGAEAYNDPMLHLSAAESYLKLAAVKGRGGVPDDDRCLTHVRIARAQLEAPPSETPRVDPDEHAALRAWSDELMTKAERHKAQMSVRRNGHGQLAAGAVLTTAGLASLGVMAGGLYLNRISERELDRGEGRPDSELEPIHAQKKRGETMIAAGAIAGAVGLALGVALLTLGARDLKAARTEKLAARLRVAPTVAPTFGGLVVVGRF